MKKEFLAHGFYIIFFVAFLNLSGCVNNSRNVNDANLAGITIAQQVCASCHGMTGESISPMFPKLAGQSREYLSAQLIDFKGHERSDLRGAQYMWGFTHLTPKQVDELAGYFSSQAPMYAKRAHTELLARGESVFRNGIAQSGVVQCVACHGKSGEGNGAFPRLAGQHAQYVMEQIKVFKETERRPRGAAMKQITHDLTEADMAAVSYYIESIGASQ